MAFEDAVRCLEGLATGDAFGNSLRIQGSQGTADSAARKELPSSPWRWTDDTQMAQSVLAELEQRGRIDQASLARRMMQRFLADPARGYGSGTRKILEQMTYGEYFQTAAQAVYEGGSYGSAASARSAVIGAFYTGNPWRALRESRLAAGVTHLHPEGVAGAIAVSVTAAMVRPGTRLIGANLLLEAAAMVPDSQVKEQMLKAVEIPRGALLDAVCQLGNGLQSTAQDTVPFSLWCAAHSLNDYEEALWTVASSRGQVDTLGAIVGAIVSLSSRSIPESWIQQRERLPVVETSQFEIPKANDSQLVSMAVQKSRLSHDDAALVYNARSTSVRVDPLTGLPNLLGLFDRLDRLKESSTAAPFSLLAVHLTAVWDVNRIEGRAAGDELLKEYARFLKKNFPAPVFRVGGDKFVLLMSGAALSENSAAADHFSRATFPGCLERSYSSPHMAVIHFEHEFDIVPGFLLACLTSALADRQYPPDYAGLREFFASTLRVMPDFPWMVVDLAEQMIQMGNSAEEAMRLAFTDGVSQLPNMRAAYTALENAIAYARAAKKSLAVLMIDGDNLREFNKISIEAGDEAIRLLGRTLRQNLREADFLARWRVGDEFLILLPGINYESAGIIAGRLCQAVEMASQVWVLPETISIGVAVYPQDGVTLTELLKVAEIGLSTAKRDGKNQVFHAAKARQTEN
jgi:diguanylate cyclase (GGDEF)-like protein